MPYVSKNGHLAIVGALLICVIAEIADLRNKEYRVKFCKSKISMLRVFFLALTLVVEGMYIANVVL